MKNEKKYTVSIIVDFADGTSKNYEDLTAEEKSRLAEKQRERLSRNMSRFYSAHPDLFERL